MKYILVFVAMIFVSSCITTEKATNFLKKNGELAEICADNYPAVDSLIAGDTVIVTDTLETFDRDTMIVSRIVNDTLVIIKTPPPKIIQKTVRITDTIVRVDKAKVEALNIELNKKNGIISDRDKTISEKDKSIEKLKRQRNKFMWWFFVLLGAIGVLTVLRLKKIISL